MDFIYLAQNRSQFRAILKKKVNLPYRRTSKIIFKGRFAHQELHQDSVAASLLLSDNVWNMWFQNRTKARHKLRYKFNAITCTNS